MLLLLLIAIIAYRPMGHKWSARRRNTTTAAKNSDSKAHQSGWNNNKRSTSLPQTDTANDRTSTVSQAQAHTVAPADDDQDDHLANNITIYRSYSNMAPQEAEVQPCRLSSAGIRSVTACCCGASASVYKSNRFLPRLFS